MILIMRTLSTLLPIAFIPLRLAAGQPLGTFTDHSNVGQAEGAAVMAAGEAVAADGRAWITAAAVAYEVQCRLCDAASIRARGWDHTTYGSLSSSLARALCMALPSAAMSSEDRR